jgi:hypothetical protein
MQGTNMKSSEIKQNGSCLLLAGYLIGLFLDLESGGITFL